MPEAKMSIALLSQAGESGRHLREALIGSGAPIVYEAQAAELDRDALEKSGARVIVVNLDTDVEAHLDEVYSLLGDDRYNVIFNEAQVSSQLSGWEQARWARHLAAKILGAESVDPPRPAGAEPVPQRVARTPPPEPLEDEPQAHADAQAVEAAAPETAPIEQSRAVEEVEADDFSDIARLLDEIDPQPLAVAQTAHRAPPGGGVDLHETVPMPVLDLSEFDLQSAPIDEAQPESRLADESAPAQAEPTREMPAFELPMDTGDEAEPAGALGFGDLDDFADGADAIEFSMDDEAVPDSRNPANALDSEMAEAADAGDAAAAGAGISELQMLDLDWADAPASPESGTAPEMLDETPAPAPTIGSAFAWSLEDIDEPGATNGQAADGVPAKPREFGIETVPAAEYLAPEAEQVADESFDAGMSLELIPLDEAVAPQPGGQGAASQPGRESWLDISNKPVVSRVWVLGASIGGPEAVREFLAELPAKCPALFLLAQHMGAEFMEIMSQQLVRSTALNVRTPTHGERVGHGDIVVVPTTHRLRVDREGVVTLESIDSTSLSHSPSIDQVISDVADRFGARAGAIVFSGMAEDAAEGSRYLAGKGGKVCVQDPETCVISSMVDGVIDTGVVAFTGSPKALAAMVLGDMKSAETRNP